MTRLLPSRITMAAFLAAGTILAGCSSSSHSTTNSTAAPAGASGSGAHVTIDMFSFHPASLTVTPGEKITVTNDDSAPHTLTGKGDPKPFDTGTLSHGQSVTITAPSKPGSYPFYCQIHVFMTGTLTVS